MEGQERKIAMKDSTGKGRGMFAIQPIKRGEVVEISPILHFSAKEWEEHARFTLLEHYTFTWVDGGQALALGVGSIFNHHRKPNVGYTRDPKNLTIIYTATQDIDVGEELCISYGDQSKLWFDDADGPQEPDSPEVDPTNIEFGEW
eukprot:TRINITY_DN1386_c0_g1_i1.p2 TRINITY_DN1386_c0_g1~~TRINITY_DN1386_c0_g1_i1.p2  ORF type:complete len:156 (-),score=17.92 TRINITY_DN1386_c0_g1_i1:1002-1439(-)